MDSLQSLVKALSKSEKRYFTLFATAFKTNSDLVKLFDVLDEEADYNEDLIKEKTGIKNLAAAKTNLRKLILKVIRNYREGHNPMDEVRCGLMEVEFLISKNLRTDAKKELTRLKKFAEENEVYAAVAELTARGYMLTETPKTVDKMRADYDLTITALDETIEAMREQYKAILYQSMYGRYFNFFNYINTRERDTIIKNAIAETTELLNAAKTPRGKIVLRDALAGQYYNLGDNTKAINLYHQNFELFLKDVELKKTNRNTYFATVSNYMVCAASNGRNDLLNLLINDLEESLTPSKDYYQHNPEMLGRIKNRILASKVTMHKNMKQYAELITLEKEIEEILELEDTPMQMVLKNNLVLRFSGALLQAGYFDKTLNWVNNYFTLETAKQTKVNYTVIRLLEVMAFYELGQLDIAMTKANNLYKSINEADTNDPFYKPFGQFLRKLAKWDFNNAKDIAEAGETISEMENISGPQTLAGQFFEIFPFREWFEGKKRKK